MTYYTYYGQAGGGSATPLTAIKFPYENPFFLGANISILEFTPVPSPGIYPGDWTAVPDAITQKMIDYGFKILRLPIRMERAQPTPNGALHEPYMIDIDNFVNYATSRGVFVIIDCHNYMRRREALDNATTYPMGSAQFPNSYFYDFWTKIADRYKANLLVRFDLMNEPENEVTHTPDFLLNMFNATISAIRGTGAENIIYTTTRAYSNASTSIFHRIEKLFLQTNDPLNKTYVTLHQYLNPTASGNGADAAVIFGDQIVTYRLQQVTDLARFYGKKLMLGETGIAKNEAYSDAFYTLYDFLVKNSDVWEAATLWTGGAYPDASNYPYKLHVDTALIPTAPTPSNTQMIIDRVAQRTALPNETFLHWEKTGKTFCIGSLDEVFDFKRASIACDFETKTTTNNSDTRQYLKKFAVNEMRLIGDKGLRVEPQRTNIFPSATWRSLPNYNEVNASIENNAGVAVPYPSPDGLNTAARFDVTAVAGQHYILLGQATGQAQTPGISHTVSIFCKSFESYFIWLNGSDSTSGGALRSNTTLSSVRNYRKGDWTRCWVNNIIPVNTNFRVRVGSNGGSTGDTNTVPASYTPGTGEFFNLWHPQVEPNAFYPSTPILGVPLGGNVTRSADIVTLLPHLINKINQNFTLIIEFEDLPFHFSSPSQAAYSLPLLLVNGIEALRINNDQTIGGDFGQTQATTAVKLSTDGAIGLGWRRSPRKYGFSVDFTGNAVTIGVQGNVCTTAITPSSIPPITSLQIGQNGGCMSRFTLLTGYKDNAELTTALLRN